MYALIFGWLRSLHLGAAITASVLRLKRMIILDVGAIATQINLVNSPMAEFL
ncbi:hypothetical protein [Nostoc sp. LPT]|uniref:hypothetical protein n=1 Tax=Nostoc sp. LPT TaxID=2815387 RepID=UPI001D729446|nr:hypothetical protein [Nostoc sp. LPT]MBN4003671.1 hypothetical protein [Nostoc sp. LPT]